MANEKISELGAATLPLDGEELFAVVQGGTTKKVGGSAVGTLQGFAYDAGNSDLPNGIFATTAGVYQNDNGAGIGDASEVDLSGENDGDYYLVLSDGTTPFARSASRSLAGMKALHKVSVTSGAITYTPATDDVRNWSADCALVANIAAQMAGTTSPGQISLWVNIATLTFEDFQAGTLSAGDTISTIAASYAADANSFFGATMIEVTEAFAGPSLATATLNASGFSAGLTTLNMMVEAKTLFSIARTTLASGNIAAVATISAETWPDMTAGSLNIYVLLSRIELI